MSEPNFAALFVLPLEILPVAGVGASIFHLLILVVLVTLGIALAGPGLSWSALWLPVTIFPFVLFILGVAWRPHPSASFSVTSARRRSSSPR